MSLRPPDIDIDPDEPFANDKLARETQVKSLCELVTSDPEPVVIAVDGKFGSGKSTFLRMCAAQLREQENVVVVEFNAWQQSHTKNPLIDLTSALILKVQDNKLTQQLQELLKRIATGLGWSAASLVTNGAINPQHFQEPGKEPLFSRWEGIEKQREEFHGAIADILKETGGSFVVLLDELDRCMPQQVLDYLNIVRHLFDVPGVVVVIGVNQKELAHRVKHLYGEGCDAEVYLRRFWDFTLPLGEPTSEQLTAFLNVAFHGADVSERLSAVPNTFTDEFWKLLVRQSGMGLRDIQQTVHYLARVLTAVPVANKSNRDPFDKSTMFEQLLLAVFALRCIDRDTYTKLVSNECSVFDAAARFRENLNLNLNLDVYDIYPGHYLIALLLRLDPNQRLNQDEGTFIQLFVDADVGDKKQGVVVHGEYNGIPWSSFRAMPSLEHIDSLLSLTR